LPLPLLAGKGKSRLRRCGDQLVPADWGQSKQHDR
jgi:hypothetical protein